MPPKRRNTVAVFVSLLACAFAACSDSSLSSTATGELSIEPSTLDLGNLEVGAHNAEIVVVKNAGKAPLDIAEVIFDNAAAPDIEVASREALALITLSEGELPVEFRFAPSAFGDQIATFTVRATDGQTATATITGRGSLGCLSCSSSEIDFGAVDVGTTREGAVRCENTAGRDIFFAEVEQEVDPFFILTGVPDVGSTLPAQESILIHTRYQPSAAGEHLGQISLVDASAECAISQIRLSAVAEEAPIPVCFPPETFNPVMKWEWEESTVDPDSRSVGGSPIVIQLTDDDGDGAVTPKDIPDVVFISHGGENPPGVNSYTPAGTLRAISGADGTEIWSVSKEIYPLEAWASPAAGDLDGDGVAEIIVQPHHLVDEGFAGFWHVAAIRADGTFMWESERFHYEPDRTLWGIAENSTISIADLDADGSPEIISGSNVISNTGQLLWTGQQGSGHGLFAMLSATADLDGDGKLELIGGNTAYHSDGSIYWHLESVVDGGVAIANCDDDPEPEIAIHSDTSETDELFSIVNHDGTFIVENASVPGYGPGGGNWKVSSIAAGDVDGDGKAEFIWAYPGDMVVVNCAGELVWRASVDDASGMSGPAVFDFNGDGRVEVLYHDESTLEVYDGLTGDVIYAAPRSHPTIIETPVIADVDNDRHADVLITYDAPIGIRAYSNEGNNWVATATVWNQYNYHVTNINPDGSVPIIKSPHWATHNVFRGNVAYCVPEEGGE